MTSYDAFAPYYDLTMGDRPDAADTIDAAISKYHPSATTLLELGCGTGNGLTQMPSRFELTGIDKSAEMLKIAQRKLPKAHLSTGDISRFELAQQFDIITCIFDTINHLPNFTAWLRCFEHVARHLKPGGLFIFDINTIGRLGRLAAMGDYIQNAGDITIEMAVTSAGPSAVDWHITVQDPQPDGLIQVVEDHAREQSYPLADIVEAVEQHFELLEYHDSEGLSANNDSDRIYLVCRRIEK